MGTWCSCVECIGDQQEPSEMECWLADKEAEYKMRGLSEKDAKEKAMSDWHTYQAPNEVIQGQRSGPAGMEG